METLRHIFLSPDEPRLRAGWRLLGQLMFGLALLVLFSIPAAVVLLLRPETMDALNVVVNAFVLIPSVWAARRWLDRRSLGSLGLTVNSEAARDVLVGLVIAGVQMLAVYLLALGAGWLKFEGFAWEQAGWPEAMLSLAEWGGLFLLVGFYEELFSRGYQLQNLEEGLNTFWAVALSSSFFGVMHLTNPGATVLSTLGVAAAGVFFAFAYLRTRSLWLAIGLHIGWNFFEGPVFGFKVSGLATGGLLQHSVAGPEAWTGGAFGPEAGLAGLLGLLVGAGLVYAYTRGRKPALNTGER